MGLWGSGLTQEITARAMTIHIYKVSSMLTTAAKASTRLARINIIVLSAPWTENGRSDPHQRRPFFDRHRIIVRHAHRKLSEIDVGRVQRLKLVAQLAQRAKIRPDLFRLVPVGR